VCEYTITGYMNKLQTLKPYVYGFDLIRKIENWRSKGKEEEKTEEVKTEEIKEEKEEDEDILDQLAPKVFEEIIEDKVPEGEP